MNSWDDVIEHGKRTGEWPERVEIVDDPGSETGKACRLWFSAKPTLYPKKHAVIRSLDPFVAESVE